MEVYLEAVLVPLELDTVLAERLVGRNLAEVEQAVVVIIIFIRIVLFLFLDLPLRKARTLNQWVISPVPSSPNTTLIYGTLVIK